ncbi:MAG: hypothetical protein JWR44_1982 [Hymenobacter sp.]|nr:hypothetical protein [Hymenobacter sp.]
MSTDSTIAIYCPHCYWEPDGGAHWVCTCGCVWNTFDTAAVCPQCRYRWQVTGCPPGPGGCGVYAPHIGWYHGLREQVADLLETAIPAPIAVCCTLNES